MQVTYYGHSCFGLTLEGKRILLDPFITPNKLAASIQLKDIQADYILLSHAHEDHVADALTLAQQTGALLIGTFEVTTWFESKGVTNVHPMNIGGQKSTDFGTIKMLNAVHTSSFADGTPGGSAAGFLIQSNGRTIYYAGDTALHYDMKFLGKFYKVDLAFLPIGDNFTMGVEDAIIASKFIKCDRIVGMHFDTFGYIKLDHSAAKSAFADADKTLYLMNIGETTDL